MRPAIRYGQWLLLAAPLIFVAVVVAFPDDAELRVELPALFLGAVVMAATARAASFGAAAARLAAIGAVVVVALSGVAWLFAAALGQEGADTFESVAVGSTIVVLGTVVGGGIAVLFGGAAYGYARTTPTATLRLAFAAVALSPFAFLLVIYGLDRDRLGLAVTGASTAWLVAALREARTARATAHPANALVGDA